LPGRQRFSEAVLDKATKEFMKLSIERGDWLKKHELNKIFPKVYNYLGKFIIEHFGFTSYFKRGKSLYLHRKDLLALRNELKQRKIILRLELVKDQDKLQKSM
jgi:hypothetical protein